MPSNSLTRFERPDRRAGVVHGVVVRAAIEGVIAGLVTMGVVFVSVSGLLRMADDTAKRHLRDELSVLAAAAATTIDPVEHDRMRDPVFQNTEEYDRAVEPLRKILRAAPGVTYIYTAVMEGDSIRFVLDAAEPGDHDNDGREDQAQIWEEYPDADPVMYDAFLGNDRRGAIVSSGEPFTDAWGTFVTGYAPFHHDDGTLAGVVGVDMRADRYMAEAAERAQAGMFGLIPGALLSGLVGFVVSSIRRSQLRTVRVLNDERHEARRLAKELSSTMARLDIATESGNVGVWEWNTQTDALVWDDRMYRLYGVDPADFNGTLDDWCARVHPDDLQPTVEAARRAAENRQNFEAEFRVVDPSGASRHIGATGRLILDEEGRAVRMLGVNIDVTAFRRAVDAARANEERFRLFVEQAPTAIAMFDREMRYIAASRRWSLDYGINEREVLGRSHYEVFPEITDEWKAVHARCMNGAVERRETDRMVRADGREQWISWEVRPWRDASGEIGGVVMFTADVSDRVRDQQLLERTNEIARVGGWEIDLRTMTPVWSKMVREIHGVDDDYIPTMTSAIEFFAPEHRERIAQAVRRAVDVGEPYDIESELITARGDRIWVQTQGEPVFHNGRCVRLTGVIRDVTELRRAQDHLRELSETDRLTGLPNRTRFTEDLRGAVEQARVSHAPIAVLFFDFDRFKQVNDAMGHAAGDKLLRSIADRFRESLLEGDTVARFGGDEFVVLLRSVRDVRDAARIADRLVSMFAAPHEVSGTSVVSTASAGLAYFDGQGDADPEQLMGDADTALHEAKAAGKNRCRVFDDMLRETVRRRHEIETALRTEGDNGAIRITYEPVASLESGEISGYIAGVRCEAPAAQGLSQRDLFAIIDDTGSGMACFLSTLRAVCADASRLRESHPDRVPWIVVPMTTNTLAHPMLLQAAKQLMREFVPPSGTIRIGVPEAAMCDPRHDLSEPLRALRGLGFGVVVQHFGGGAASLTGLKDRPVDGICLDTALVEGLPGDRAITAILNAALTLANNLGIEAIASGVERGDQITALQTLNCGYGMGPALGEATGLGDAHSDRSRAA